MENFIKKLDKFYQNKVEKIINIVSVYFILFFSILTMVVATYLWLNNYYNLLESGFLFILSLSCLINALYHKKKYKI